MTQEKYQPSEEEIKKAENMLTPAQARASKTREGMIGIENFGITQVDKGEGSLHANVRGNKVEIFHDQVRINNKVVDKQIGDEIAKKMERIYDLQIRERIALGNIENEQSAVNHIGVLEDITEALNILDKKKSGSQ